MLCIASFILFAILGIFSAKYRSLTAKAWYCVKRRITLKPCDINFGEEVKSRLLGKMILKRPRLARFLDKWISWLAFAFVILSIWSLFAVIFAGLNLWVYDTCDPVSGESCSLSGEACGIGTTQLGFIEAIQQNRVGEWAAQPFVKFGETVSRIPDRFKNWNPKDYISSTASYYSPYDDNKPVALEIIDPGCQYCKELFHRIQTTGFEKRYNLTYIAYPIPDVKNPGNYKFSNSVLISRYLESVKKLPLINNPNGIAPDWQLLEIIFTKSDEENREYQNNFNLLYNRETAENKLKEFLMQMGYSETEVTQISILAASEEITRQMAANREIVEQKIKTIKIPTILFNGRRYDRLVDENTLRN